MDLLLSSKDSAGDPSSAFGYRMGLPCRPQPLSKLVRRSQATNFLTCLHHSVSVQSSPASNPFNRESQLHPPRGSAQRALAIHAALSHVLLDGFAIASSFPTIHLVRGTFSRPCLELSAASQLHQPLTICVSLWGQQALRPYRWHGLPMDTQTILPSI